MKRLARSAAAFAFLAAPAWAQDAISLKGAVDIHVHQDPDSAPRALDADDEARQAKAAGMRAVVLKNHWEDTASLAYMVRKMVPGIQVFGGITQDLAVGGINIEAVKHMADMKGGYGRIVWLPTFDAQNQVKDKGPEVKVSENGKLLPGVLALLDYIATRKQLTLETGHVSAEEGLMVIREARARGIQHVVVTHAMNGPIDMTIPQMQEAARMGAYIEFVYGATLEKGATLTVEQFAQAMRAVGPEHCIMSTDLGGARPYPRPLPTAGMLKFMQRLHKLGISVADINTMSKTNPARVLGLEP
ncbi:MAG TPA: DUF6282 family protein [Rhizomicrobium sp.]|nr:DUF6282 family protein [Rhizomicrobium sp.]